ncbi:hypothetical protein PE067_01210 [Paracoccus sp. DMF-8]|uniref:hypothetical protein n=1 Tax=Paracoccus sp. DMF-8 TaxID=3019445 RepID=UPI0023E8557C|nr:hypothetical protein [Paracoccus sp. DMF-8]MDF3604889.1 hypothetical protein [Paracoccus sp. DMF-8]
MPRRLVTAALLLAAPPLAAQDLASDVLACRKLDQDPARLACYDGLRVHVAFSEFRGAGNRVIAPFDLPGPARLVFESMDAIMVVYLLDERGQVIQNLHQAGAGSGAHMIDRPGRYGIQVNASGGWRLRLETP